MRIVIDACLYFYKRARDLYQGRTLRSVTRQLSKVATSLCQCPDNDGIQMRASMRSQTRLHIGHIIDLSHGGSDDAQNLRALCSVCNEGAQNLTLPRPKASQLLAQMRRAGGEEQLEVLKWLVHKYPKQAKSLSSGIRV